MNVYKTETEQVEDLKRWIKGYGPSVITGIVLALVISYGWRYWNSYKTHKAEQASTYYSAMMQADQDKKADVVSSNADKLMNQFPSSPYAQFASMLLAKNDVEQKNYDQAIKQLQWVSNHSKDDNTKIISQIRIARIQIQDNQAKQALTTLSKLNSSDYQGLISIVQGDAYLALGDAEKAKAAYTEALSQIPNADNAMPTLRIKLANVNALLESHNEKN